MNLIQMRYIVVTVLMLSLPKLYAQSSLVLPKSFQAKFEQHITSDKKNKISYVGTIKYSLQRFKWSYKIPTKKDVCSSGKELIVVDHGLEQVSRYIVDDGLDLHAIMQQAKLHRKSVYIASYKGTNYTIQIDKQKRLSRIAYRDNLDNNVLIIFEKMRYSNKEISRKNLVCKIPQTYDQIGG